MERTTIDHIAQEQTTLLSINGSSDSNIADYSIYVKLGSYYVATLIIIGIIGNVISFILFSTTRRLKRIPSSQYLAALSLTDLTFVSCLSLIWLKSFGVNWQDSTVICPVSIFLSNTSCLLSGWYIMALTAEMTLAIVDPYRARRHCSRGLVARRIIGIACFGVLINSWTLVIARSVPVSMQDDEDSDRSAIHLQDTVNRSCTDHLNRSCPFNQSSTHDPLDTPIFTHVQEVRLECSFHSEHEEYYNNLTILDSVISFSIPLLVTLALNITIGCFLLRSLAKRQNLVARKFSDNVVATSTSALAVAMGAAVRRQRLNRVDSPATTSVLTPDHENGSLRGFGYRRRNAKTPLLLSNKNSVDTLTRKRSGRRTRVTLVSSLLITKSLIYLILNLPNYVHRLWQMTRTASEDEQSYQYEKLMQLIVYLLFYTQYSLNFFIYSMHACKTACCPRSGMNSSGRRMRPL